MSNFSILNIFHHILISSQYLSNSSRLVTSTLAELLILLSRKSQYESETRNRQMSKGEKSKNMEAHIQQLQVFFVSFRLKIFSQDHLNFICQLIIPVFRGCSSIVKPNIELHWNPITSLPIDAKQYLLA